MEVKVFELVDAVEVICSHPEDSSRYYRFGTSADINWSNQAEVDEYISEVKRQITEKVNPHGYWHDVEINFLVLCD